MNNDPSRSLKGVQTEFWHGTQLHFVLKLEKLGPLGAAPWPGEEMDWVRLSSIGFRWVICLCTANPDYDPFPLEFLESIELQDLSGGQSPRDPKAEFKKITTIATEAYSKLKEGGILIHCAGGRGRTGTIIARILCHHCGYGSAEVIDFLNTVYRKVGKPGWPESPWQSEIINRPQPPE